MATLARHVRFLQLKPKNLVSNLYATKAEKKKGLDRKQPPKINQTHEALAAKGFLRAQTQYTPPNDVDQKIEAIFQKITGNSDTNVQINDLGQKCTILKACAKEFNHSVPNSQLYLIKTIKDICEFYKTEINTITPLDNLKNLDLPENLHVQYDYHRFNPETDTKFKGQTAFNRSSTLVTGLKYKDKYKGHVQNQTWPYNS